MRRSCRRKGAKDWWIGGSEVVESLGSLPVHIEDTVYGQLISVGRHGMRDEDAMLQHHIRDSEQPIVAKSRSQIAVPSTGLITWTNDESHEYVEIMFERNDSILCETLTL